MDADHLSAQSPMDHLPTLTFAPALAPRSDIAATRRAVRAHGGRVTVGDVMAATGMGEIAAEAALKSLLAEYPAVLEVREDGTLIYIFESTSLAKRWLERTVDGVRRFVGGTLLTVAKVGVMVTVVAYSVFFAVAAVVLAIAAVFASESGDFLDGDGALEILAFPFRLLAEMLFWAPDWLVWGTATEHDTAARHRDRTPAYERIFRYLFGPPSPRLRESQVVRLRAELIRQHRGVLTAADLMRHAGLNRAAAEHELARLVGRLGGDVAATDSGHVVYTFTELMRRADATLPLPGRRAPSHVAFEGQRPLTGNSHRVNAVIVSLAAITLAGGLAGGALFEKLGILGTLPLLLGSWIPVAVGATFLVLPPLRALLLRRENRGRAERDARRALVDAHEADAPLLSVPEWATRLGRSLDPAAVACAERVLRDVGTDFGAEVDGSRDTFRYAIPALTSEFAAGSAVREARRLDRPAAAEIAFSSSLAPAPQHP